MKNSGALRLLRRGSRGNHRRPMPQIEDVAPQTHVFDRAAMDNLGLADQILFERFGQGPITALPHERIQEPFEHFAAVNPTAVAVEHLGETITYSELERQANRLATHLAELGVRTGDNVALFLKRSIPMIVGILGTLKAGAAYVPQDVGIAPDTQLRHIMDVAETRVVLTTSQFRHLIPDAPGQTVLEVDGLMQQPFSDLSSYRTPFQPQTPIQPDNRCFLLFTSGTTGNPNGVQVTHRNVCNILLTEPGDLGMRPGLKVSQILNIAFDMAAWEILGCLSHGATLVIRGKDIAAAVQQADIVIATPSVLGAVDAEQCRNVKVVAVAGEPCPLPLAERWAAFCTFYNSCGPTETTIVNTMQPYRAQSGKLTIGKPTPNNTVYVLNEDRRPCAIGEVGEMWAGGLCVTAGYLKNPQRTDERYAPDPFLGDGQMMFRTRDLGRWTADGELIHLGRTDDQVKIRGYRVELDSVSNALESTPGCAQAVTLKFDSRNLVAFVRPSSVDVDAAREAVAKSLPYYCTPAFVLALDDFPVTSRGKVDKRALLELAREYAEKAEALTPIPHRR
ncbi:MAG: amino acid adenylation domain-containing protein [Caldilineaceae bacterium]